MKMPPEDKPGDQIHDENWILAIFPNFGNFSQFWPFCPILAKFWQKLQKLPKLAKNDQKSKKYRFHENASRNIGLGIKSMMKIGFWQFFPILIIFPNFGQVLAKIAKIGKIGKIGKKLPKTPKNQISMKMHPEQRPWGSNP